ncbi:PilW family protein [Garciella nitratireducens]|uniref:PilW family protein n=1 Tax=Garciella nitratireducens TaxID=218205 RepID=UPI000DE90570|nr:prepilin-type N-terminal cleavage/methylation domain-containing protein [Garciella nitratireducens]RBP46675.1 prepilin-type N-terminal cleavage/methylation domain-containing protein [Garciella nitratireducens]
MFLKFIFPIKNKKLKKGEKGFTFIELIVVMALIGIIFPVVVSMFFIGIRSYKTSEDQLESHHNARWTFMYIERQIKSSEKIYIKNDIKNNWTILYLQDMETPQYYNYYFLNKETGILMKYKVDQNLKSIGLGSTSQLASNIKNFEFIADVDSYLFYLHITSEVNGKEFDLKSNIRAGGEVVNLNRNFE